MLKPGSAGFQGMIRRQTISHGENGAWVLVSTDGSVLGKLIMASGPDVSLEVALSDFQGFALYVSTAIQS